MFVGKSMGESIVSDKLLTRLSGLYTAVVSDTPDSLGVLDNNTDGLGRIWS